MDYTRLLAYAMSKAINILQPLMGKMSYHVKNTATFSKEMIDFHVEEDEIMNCGEPLH